MQSQEISIAKISASNGIKTCSQLPIFLLKCSSSKSKAILPSINCVQAFFEAMEGLPPRHERPASSRLLWQLLDQGQHPGGRRSQWMNMTFSVLGWRVPEAKILRTLLYRDVAMTSGENVLWIVQSSLQRTDLPILGSRTSYPLILRLENFLQTPGRLWGGSRLCSKGPESISIRRSRNQLLSKRGSECFLIFKFLWVTFFHLPSCQVLFYLRRHLSLLLLPSKEQFCPWTLVHHCL